MGVVIVTRRGAGAMEGADRGDKAAEVGLLEVRWAMHRGGKGWFVLAGTVGDVESAGAGAVEDAGDELLGGVVIPRASQELLEHLFQ